MSKHQPKLRALEALQQQRLSAPGEARLQRHLDGCPTCREAARGQRITMHLIEQVRATDPELDFAKIQAGLARSARERRRRLLGLSLLAPAAAAAVTLWFALDTDTADYSDAVPPSAAPTPVPAPSAGPAESFAASVTALAGPATLYPSQRRAEPLRVDSALQEGDRLVLGDESVAHLRLDRASGCIAGPGTELTIARARRDETEVTLHRGRLTSEVEPRGATGHFRIQAGGYTVAVRGTHFEVTKTGDKLDVMVAEGRVIVADDTGAQLADLRARDHFAIDAAFGMRLATRDPSHPSLELEHPRGLGIDLASWPLLTLQDVAALERFGVTSLSLDGTRFPIPGELAMRVPRGDVTLIVERLTVAPQNIVLHVPAEGLSLAADALRRLLKLHKPDATPAPEIDFQPVLAVVRAGTASLQRCYERALKQRPELDGRLTIRLSIDGNGRVTQAQPRSQTATLPADLVECMRNVAGQWSFPDAGAPLAFDVPLRLQPR